MTRTHPLLLLLLALSLLPGCGGDDSTVTVGYLVGDGEATVPSEVSAWAAGEAGVTVSAAPVADAPPADVLWLAIPDSAAWHRWLADSTALFPMLRDAARDGRGLLLSGYAALLPHRLGWESNPPEIRSKEIHIGWFFDSKRGLQSQHGHPVLAGGLHGGAFLWDMGDERTVPLIGYFGIRHWPEQGRVVAVGKRYVNLEPDDKLLIEHDLPGGGRSLALGGWFSLADSNRAAFRTRQFLTNTVRYLAGQSSTSDSSFWIALEDTVGSFTPATAEPLAFAPVAPVDSIPRSALAYAGLTPREDDWYSLGGRRTLVMGDEPGGISEVWTFPIRLLRDYRAAVQLGDQVHWLDKLPCELTVRPEAIERRYTTPAGPLTETVFTSPDKPGMAVEYRWGSPVNARLVITYLAELRWMWPYDADAQGTIQATWRDDLPAWQLRDPSGRFHGLFGANVPPLARFEKQANIILYDGEQFISKPSGHNSVAVGRVYPLTDDGLRYVITGSNTGEVDALTTYRALHEDPAGELAAHAAHVDGLLDRYVTLDSPDPAFNRHTRWSLPAIDRFWIDTPGVGYAMMAGFGTREKGWTGEQEISSRPGYAWYFGRDAVWAAFAVLDYGDFASVRRQLETFRAWQDLSGKIYHELSASGVVHFDAADATPLYLILAAEYLRHSGDLATLQDLWPSLRDALSYLRSTDRDGDGWIDNLNEGHGWVEGGKLWGSRTSLYLAGLQARAWADMAWLAGTLGHTELAGELAAEADGLRSRLGTEWYDTDRDLWRFGLNPDGSYDDEPTILPATTIWLNPVEPERAAPMLDRWASEAFTSDWGVRILGRDSERFNPRSYHGGSVWPLFTGWAALAEYRYHRPLSGFSHVQMTYHVKDVWSEGYVEEVLHGSEFSPHGMCPHQAWSETAAFHPVLSGLVGWLPDATNQRAGLLPQLPVHWDSLTVRNLRVGETVLDVAFQRTGTTSRWTITRTAGPPVDVSVAPGLPPSTRVRKVTVNGEAVAPARALVHGRLDPPVNINVDSPAVIEISTRGGISMLPVEPDPQPGETSHAPRIIHQEWRDNTLRVISEGLAGSVVTLRCRVIGGRVTAVSGGRIVGETRDGISDIEVRYPSGGNGEYLGKTLVIGGELR